MLRAFVVGMLALAGAAPLAAQVRAVPVHRHDDFWLSFGAGGGWDDPAGLARRGGVLYVRLGGTPHRQFLFGGELLAWSDAGDQSRAAVTATALLYPFAAGGPFVKAGFGAAGYTAGPIEASGIATTVGVGADVRLGWNFYLTPNVDWLVQFFEDATRSLVLVSLGVTWH